MATKKVPKSTEIHKCITCDYITSRKSHFDRHLITDKHKKRQSATNGNKKVPKSTTTHTCRNCKKCYKDRSGLWRHEQKCDVSSDFDGGVDINNLIDGSDNFVINKELVMSVLKQNTDLQSQLMKTQTQVLETQNQVMELLKNGTHNTNSHNKTFNLNFFLNETCKNAMNIMDFVNNLQLQLGDLEKMEDIGYVNGMSNIIIKNLKDMDVTERPVHCTDAKREVLYVKDEDKWDKETSDKPKIRKAIKHVAHKNARLLQEFKEKHPDCTKSESKHSDTYTKLMVEAMGGKGSNDDEQESKIIKKVSKEITLGEVNP